MVPKPRDDDAPSSQDEFAQLQHQITQIRSGARDIFVHTRDAAVSILTSKKFQRGIISTALLVTGTVVLYGIAVMGYLGFYYTYLPDMVKEVPVHLQYGWGPNPFGVVEVDFRARQRYDILVELTLPKTAENGRKGNWMVVMHWMADGETKSGSGVGSRGTISSENGGYYLLHSAGENVGGGDVVTSFFLGGFVRDKKLLGTAARAAMVPYEDPLVSTAGRLLFLPWHIFFPTQAEAVTLKIRMAEGLRFEKGETLPKSLVLELQAGQGLHVYSAKVVLVAQLRGLRYLMYRWRLTSFFVITGLFWATEVVLMCVAALVMGYWLSGRSKEDKWDEIYQELDRGIDGEKTGEGMVIKREEEDMSDTERTFPTSTRQPPLKYESSSNETKVKKEGGEDDDISAIVPDFGVEGDDEEDGEGSGFRDTGIGTSYSDAARRDGAARKRNISKSRLSSS